MLICFDQIACVYVFVCGPRIFGFSPPDAVRRSNIFTNLHRRESCLTVNKIWVFHPGGGGDLPHLVMPNTLIFISISFINV